MTVDPRRILEDASQLRVPCELLLRTGGVVKATVMRVEKSGVVLTTPERRFVGGEDLRVLLWVGDRGYTFEASVIRAGVPVPDRSQDGVLLGFIDGWMDVTDVESKPDSDDASQGVLELVPPNGPPISILKAPIRLMQLTVEGMAFSVPTSFKLVFVESGSMMARLGGDQDSTVDAQLRVRTFAPADGFVLYEMRFEGVTEPEAHRDAVTRLIEARAL